MFSLRRLTGRVLVRGWEFSFAGLALLGFGLAAVAALRFSEAPGELASVFSAVLAAVLGGTAGGVLLSVVRRLAATGRSCWRLTVPLLLAAASVWFLVLSSGPRVSAPDLAAVAEVATRLADDPSLSSRMLEGAVSEPGLVAVAWGSQADGSSGSAALFWLEADGRTCWQVPVPSSSGARPLDDAVSVRLPDEFAASSPPVCSPEAFSALG